MRQAPLPMKIFTSEDGSIRLQLKVVDDTLWLTQRQIAELFEKSPKTISEHLNNIYDEGELEPDSTIRKFRTVAREGTRDVERLLDHYKLDAFLEFNEHEILQNAGQVSATVAKQLAEAEYDQYETRCRETLAGQKSDFDAFIEHTQQLTDKGKH